MNLETKNPKIKLNDETLNGEVLSEINRIALVINMAFAAIALFLCWQLNKELTSLNSFSESPGFETVKNLLTPDTTDAAPLSSNIAVTVALEHDYQLRRSAMLRSFIASRLFLSSASIMAGLGLIVMGVALIIARIKEANQSTFKATVDDEKGKKGTLEFMTSFPGVMLAFFGILVISVTMMTTIFNKIVTTDAPLYFHNNTYWSTLSSPPSYRPAKQLISDQTRDNIILEITED